MHRHIPAIKNRAENAHLTGGVVVVDAEPLLELIDSAERQEWQPIETATKNKAVWVAYDGGYKGKFLATTCACWFNDGELENNGGGDEDYLPAGWYEYPSVAEECIALPEDPLYWMPLPPAPRKPDTSMGRTTVGLESPLDKQPPVAADLATGLCDDCPPTDYPTDATPSLPCPRRAPPTGVKP